MRYDSNEVKLSNGIARWGDSVIFREGPWDGASTMMVRIHEWHEDGQRIGISIIPEYGNPDHARLRESHEPTAWVSPRQLEVGVWNKTHPKHRR